MSTSLSVSLSVILFFLLGFLFPILKQLLLSGGQEKPFSPSKTFVHLAVSLGIAITMTALSVWSVVLVWIGPQALGTWPTPDPLHLLGWILYGGGLSLVVIAQAQMGRLWRMGATPHPEEFVASGIFKLIRHPIYTGMILILLGYLCLTPSPWLIMGTLQFGWLVVTQAHLEEQLLQDQFGESYVRYTEAVSGFIPKLRPNRSTHSPKAG